MVPSGALAAWGRGAAGGARRRWPGATQALLRRFCAPPPEPAGGGTATSSSSSAPAPAPARGAPAPAPARGASAPAPGAVACDTGVVPPLAADLDGLGDWSDSVKVFRLILAFRRRGHLAARLDPLRGSGHRRLSPLEPINWRIGGRHGCALDDVDVNQLLEGYPAASVKLGVFGLGHYGEHDELPPGVAVPEAWGSPPGGRWTFRAVVDYLGRSYADTLAIEHQHIESEDARRWLEARAEGRIAARPDGEAAAAREWTEERRQALFQLVRADQLERFFGEKYPSAKRFGLRGCEALLPALWTVLGRVSVLGVKRVQLGMAHRGRLNILVNLLGKKVSSVCSEFGEQVDFLGDMKYHLGTHGEINVAGHVVQLTLAANPSHLEAVDPVVMGLTRAKQDYHGDVDMRQTAAILVHGDAAFSGQGVVAECMQLADLPDYTIGGTIHLVLNNMIGFTTDPRAARSSYHCTNVAKVNDAPIIHVNADDIDAVLFAGKLAAEYRQSFRKDVVIDLVGYRRQGHSELDDDSLTQPLTRRATQKHPPVLQLYGQTLVEARVVTQEEVDAEIDQVYAEFEAEYHYAKTHTPSLADWRVKEWQRRPVNVTGLPLNQLVAIGQACNRLPEGFSAHDTVKTIFEDRMRQLNQGRVDWALAEQLALGSLLLNFDPRDTVTTGLIKDSGPADGAAADGSGEVDCYVVHPPCPVRLSGQDVERGTFNQRHSVIFDQQTAVPYNVFSDMGLGPQSQATICNSSLSELAILGFEYGYSLEEGLALTIWEAQFGDFANCAQHIIDNFIASGESKWGVNSCLTLLLPHGYEGQGPEHSSARLERFLQLVDDDPDDLWPEHGAGPGHRLAFDSTGGGARTAQPGEALDAVRRATAARRRGDAEGAPAALQWAAKDVALLQETYDSLHNVSVVNITTPANLFHALRRQVHRTFAKPLIVMSAKYLLHHRPCRSPLEHMGRGTRFRRVIEEGGPGDNMPIKRSADACIPCRRLIFCSGKVFYELHHARAARKLEGIVALARLEQIAPFPSMEVVLCACRYPDAEILWVQEEPKNMGAWAYVVPRLATALRQLSPASLAGDGEAAASRRVRYVGRRTAANPATPLFKEHKKEVRAVLDDALAF